MSYSGVTVNGFCKLFQILFRDFASAKGTYISKLFRGKIAANAPDNIILSKVSDPVYDLLLPEAELFGNYSKRAGINGKIRLDPV
jgi:hypothetical protein